MQVNHTKTVNLIDFEEHVAKIVFSKSSCVDGSRRMRDETTHVFWERLPGNDCYINAYWDEELAMEDCTKAQEVVITELSKLGLVSCMEKDQGKTYPVLEDFLWEISW